MAVDREALARELLVSSEMAVEGAGFLQQERGKLVLLLLCCNAVLYVNRANLSVAVTFMYAESQTAERVHVLAAFYYGYPLAQIAAGQWSARVGGKRVLLIAAVIWSVATLLVVPAYGLGIWAVCLARAAVGVAEGVNYPAQAALLSAWIPREERSRAFSILTAGESVGTMCAMLGCAFLAHAAGWQAVFIASSVLAMAWACAFGYIAARSPEASGKVSAEELAHICQGRGELDSRGALGWQDVPWGQMWRSQAWIAIVVPHVCFNWGYYLCLSILPDYFQTHFKAAYSEMGILTVLPYATLFIVDNLVGWVADGLLLQRWGWSLVTIRKLCTVLSLGGAGSFFLVLRTLPSCADSHCGALGVAAACVTGAVGIGGISFSGFQVNFLDISPRFSSQLMGMSNTIASLPGIFGIMSLSWFNGSFKSVFTFAAALEFLGAAWYLALGRAEDQHYEVQASQPADCVGPQTSLTEGCRL
uniref:Major facilitator superfamily (MFS) profile domain-containing protein n=1 Tax=Alexandrium monilatum TaxID=311494 RepID=A0A7S4RKM9_9DINO